MKHFAGLSIHPWIGTLIWRVNLSTVSCKVNSKWESDAFAPWLELLNASLFVWVMSKLYKYFYSRYKSNGVSPCNTIITVFTGKSLLAINNVAKNTISSLENSTITYRDSHGEVCCIPYELTFKTSSIKWIDTPLNALRSLKTYTQIPINMCVYVCLCVLSDLVFFLPNKFPYIISWDAFNFILKEPDIRHSAYVNAYFWKPVYLNATNVLLFSRT